MAAHRPFFLIVPLIFASVLPSGAEVPTWIWSKKGGADGEIVYFRKTFKAAGGKVRISATCDNQMTVFFNGQKVAESKEWSEPESADVSAMVVKGDNLIAVKAVNEGNGAAGFLAQGFIEVDGKKEEVVTDASWKFSPKGGKDWNTSVSLDESGWQPAVAVGLAGTGPWESIKENTLDNLTEAKEPEATPVASMKVKEGFKVELLHTVKAATEGSWVASCFDDKGRMIVSDQYGGLFRVTLPAIGGKPEDTKVEPIPVQLGEAQGLCWAFDSLYAITNSGKYPRGLYRVTDTNKDDTLDKVEPLRLFPNQGGEHGPHAVLPGPDGKSLYVVIGNQTPMTEMNESRVPKHWAEDNLLDPPLIGRGFMREVMAPGGWIAKTDKDGKNWELITSGFRNEYDAAFDKNGSLFTFDADMEWDFSVPWYRPTRVCEVISGGEYGWRSLSKKWPVRWEDGLPPVVDIGPGSPTGVTFGTGAKFPKKYQDALYIADWSYGKLYAVHLKGEGGGYKADVEEFITANPLPLTDVLINPKDGAMYFVIGGRRVQSGLYRVTAVNPEAPSAAPAPPPLLKLRHELEAFHGKQDPKALKTAWPYLSHEDRLIRFAARIAVEHQPVASWKDAALTEKNPRAALTALMALCRSGEGDKTLLAAILGALDRIDFTKLKGIDRETYVRDYQLAFARFGQADDALKAKTAKKLSALFPTKEPWLDVDLAEVLVFLGDADFLPKAVTIMENAPTQEEQIAHAKNLRLAKAGWNPELRERFFKWASLRAPAFKGGASFPLFMEDIKRDAVAGLTEEEKASLKPILEAKPDVKAPQFTYSAKGFVKDWTVKDLDPLLAVGLEGGRNYENGRNLFGASACFACHRFGSEGGAIGPDLTSVAGKFSPRDLLVQILEPNKEISDQYGQLEVTMLDDSKVYGRIMNLNGDKLMLNTDMMNPDAVTSIDRKRIKSMDQSKTSMMPPGLLNTCKDTDILDLLAYLLSKGDKESPLFK
jgi:putative heme-binding domain-containing protein